MDDVPAVEVAGLTRMYGGVAAVRDVDLVVGRGEFTGLLGPNGAGKSTTLKAVTGLLRPTAGSVRVNGIDVARDPRAALSGTGCLIEVPGFGRRSTPMDVLMYTGRIKGLSRGEVAVRANALLEELRIREWRDRRIETFSKGMRQRVALAQALLGNPSLLILDEPTTGLDPRGMVEFRETLADLRRFGVSLLLSSHNLHEVSAVCDSVAIMRKGEVVAQGGVRELIERFVSEDTVLTIRTAAPVTGAFLDELAGLPDVLGAVPRSGTETEVTVSRRAGTGVRKDLVDAVARHGLGLESLSENGESDLERLYMSLSLDGDAR
jgi:ABC-2 type transport system ATP-binding protein